MFTIDHFIYSITVQYIINRLLFNSKSLALKCRNNRKTFKTGTLKEPLQ